MTAITTTRPRSVEGLEHCLCCDFLHPKTYGDGHMVQTHRTFANEAFPTKQQLGAIRRTLENGV